MAKKSIAEKVFYKIWDIKNQRYVTVSREKSTWMTLGGVQDKIRSMCTNDRHTYGHMYTRKPEDFEIQMFRMVQFDVMSGRDAYEAKEKKAQEEKLRQKKISELRDSVKNIMPGVDFYRIKEMLRNKMFSETVSRNLTVIFEQITELERPNKR